MAKYITENFKKTNFSINNLHSISSLDMDLPAERLENSLLSLNKQPDHDYPVNSLHNFLLDSFV